MNVRLPLLAATLLLPIFVGGCAPAGQVMLPQGVCNPEGSAVMFGFAGPNGQPDPVRYSTVNCKK